MRTTFFSLVAVVAIILSTPSCVESTGKYKSLLNERDSIALEHQNMESDYNTTLDMLNEVEAGFAQIREVEGKIMLDVGGIEQSDKTGKALIVSQFAQLKTILENNKDRINQLQRFSNQKGKENTTLQATVQRLEKELAERIALADSLQQVIANKNIQIEGLTADLHQTQTNLDQITALSAQQQDLISTQDADLNEVWYVIDKLANLKANAIVNSNGLFKPKTILDKSFDKHVLTQADLRELKTIPTGSKNIKILSAHPEDSYQLVKDDEKFIRIEIINPAQFWSITKYLVVRKR
jgi:chromosome segregation ATPase